MIRARIRYSIESAGRKPSPRDEDVFHVTGEFKIGRREGSEIFLRDLAIHDHEATITVRESDVLIETHHSGSMTLEGAVADRAILTHDSDIRIGPYAFRLLQPEVDAPVVVSVKHHVAGDEAALAKLMPGGKQNLASSVWFGKRAAAWLFFLAAAAVGLALPIAGYMASSAPDDDAEGGGGTMLASFDNWWVSGELSDAHKYLNDRCEDCHVKPFIPVEDNACIACHEDTGHHFDTQLFTISDAAEGGCTSCHGEHQGPTGSVPTHQALCTDCHADLDQQEPKTTLINASDFGFDHPEFRPTVVVDPAAVRNGTGGVVRATLGGGDFPSENSNLRFPHNVHVQPLADIGDEKLQKQRTNVGRMMQNPDFVGDRYDGRDDLACEDCHKPDPGGASMAKVNMNDHCAFCHKLTFDPNDVDRVLPHGLPEEVLAVISDFYIAKALTRLDTAPAAAEARQNSFQKRAGGASAAQQAVRRATLDTAKGEVDQNQGRIFNGLCGQCHNVVEPASAASGEWEIAPVFVTRIWQPKSEFDHESHGSMECADCHAAEVSATSADVLLPNIDSCRDCHEGEAAEAALPSTCGMCHIYHFDDLAPLKGEVAQHPHDPSIFANLTAHE